MSQSDSHRVPPGQRLVKDFPILDLGIRPPLNTKTWSLTLSGEIENPHTLDWTALQALPQCEVVADIHCVTSWSMLDTIWVGVAAAEIVRLAQPKPLAHYVVLHSADSYTTNLPLSALLDTDVLFAHTFAGKPLLKEHGGPVRLVVPKRYFWKSAKWVTGLSFHETDQPGFWETRGYHNDADPFKEERYSR
jgi:DMSO/TMAO reductase YedYZ molybdopterin-dependent catalytic subunit